MAARFRIELAPYSNQSGKGLTWTNTEAALLYTQVDISYFSIFSVNHKHHTLTTISNSDNRNYNLDECITSIIRAEK